MTDPDALVIQEALDDGPGTLLTALATLSRRLRTAAWVLAIPVAACGLGALAFGAWAWSDSFIVLAVVVLIAATAVAAPTYVALRTGQLVTAVGDPIEVARQGRDVLGQVTTSPELNSLANKVRRRRSKPTSGKRGKLRQAWTVGRLISAVIGTTELDPARHDRLIPLTPVRLRTLWFVVWVALWAWLASVLVIAAAMATLVVT